MPIEKMNSGRQDPLVAHIEVNFEQLADDTYEPAINLPVGAIVVGGGFAVTELWNSATTDMFSIGDKEGTDAAVKTTYAAKSADVTVAGTWIPIVPTGKKYAKPGTVGLVWDGTGAAPTTGKGLLVVHYIIDKRAHSSEG
jgi:hypothetical protein